MFTLMCVVAASSASLNDVGGTFILDTGANFIAITKSFADRAKISLNTESQVTVSNGLTNGILSTADSLKVGGASSAYVPVIVSDDTKLVNADDPDNVIGLLGMSFLS